MEENESLTETLKICTNTNTMLNDDIAKYTQQIKRLREYKLENINGLNENQLKNLEERMKENLSKIKERREELMENKSICIICKENPKNIVIQGCNHFDICETCKDNLPRNQCPRCQKAFKKTLKINHLTV